EGEFSLFELVNRSKKGLNIENIPSVVYYKNKEKMFTLPQLIEPLDKLYFPTYEEFDLEDYTEKSLALTMSRGCIGRCAFCNDWKMMGKYRTRTAKHMFEEIKYHGSKSYSVELIVGDVTRRLSHAYNSDTIEDIDININKINQDYVTLKVSY
ncbi:MAG: hypothetical protein KKA79_05035, partial [Nanoarchaeota archaeon]|nr:hypothetical protein [Nanoarchaeota archaeon]